MSSRARILGPLLSALGTVALTLPAGSVASERGATAPASETTPATPAPGARLTPTPAAEAAPGTSTTATPTTTSPSESATTQASSGALQAASTPEVAVQRPQGATPAPPGGGSVHVKPGGALKRAVGRAGSSGASGSAGVRAAHPAPAPSALTPSLPLALESSIAGVPNFFIESFRIPPFLLAIYQAAGTAYGVPWQVLAAINEVETDYGRDLGVSSAGAEGWMQFLPAEWERYGVDANGDGLEDPYNPADAVFAAARYLRAAGAARSIRAAVYSYNHSQAYVDSVMLRAQLLGGTPPALLAAITGLTESRFPVHAAAHFSDGFTSVPASGSSPPQTLVGTTIYAQPKAAVIAVQDGEIVQIGHSSSLGRFISLRDAYGNTYVYAQLGDVAPLYPVLEPRAHTTVSPRIAQPAGSVEPAPSGPATAGAQPRSPLSEGATVSGLALGAAAALESAAAKPALSVPARKPASPKLAPAGVRMFREGPDDVYLHPLRVGVQVIAGTVLGHLGGVTGGATPASAAGEAHMLFQIRPAGVGAPLIDPKPILDGWVALENTSIFRAKGENPFLSTSPTVGQVLLESKQQLEPQALHGPGVRLSACARQDVQTGRVDKRLLATLEYLSVSGLKPAVSGLRCLSSTAAAERNASASSAGEAFDITAINDVPVAAHQGPGSITDITVRKLLDLQGAAQPQSITSLMGYPGVPGAVADPSAREEIRVAFSPLSGDDAHAAALFDSPLTPAEWIGLVARLGEIPDPAVAGAPSPASIPDRGGAPAGAGSEASGNR
ncbi:MAG: lytic murein transglycosylase [Solirubrobacteraceae bacterium]|jgi:hypothetical protein